MSLRCALLILWAACSSGARDGDDERCPPSAAANKEKRTMLDEDQDRVAELRDAGYDPKVASRMMWWSTQAAYFKFRYSAAWDGSRDGTVQCMLYLRVCMGRRRGGGASWVRGWPARSSN